MSWWEKINPPNSIAIFKSHAGTDVLLRHSVIVTGKILTNLGLIS